MDKVTTKCKCGGVGGNGYSEVARFSDLSTCRTIYRFLCCALRFRFLYRLGQCLPTRATTSPLDTRWPRLRSSLFQQASIHLRLIHHRWRCRQYRDGCNEAYRAVMLEKVTASDLLLDLKLCYPRSVSHPFLGDYVSLSENAKWRKLASSLSDREMLFADIVLKINRRTGKMVTHLLVLSENAVMLLDHRTLGVKYRVLYTDLSQMSMSPYNDLVLIFHVMQSRTQKDSGARKGDLILYSEHLVEIVTKSALKMMSNTNSIESPVYIGTNVRSLMCGQAVDISFRKGQADMGHGQVKVIRKGLKMDILLQS